MAIKSVPPLPANVMLIDPNTGFATPVFMRYFNDAVQLTVNALVSGANNAAAVAAAAAAAAAANAAAVTANAAAATAQTAAGTAQTAANGANVVAAAVTASSALADSYTTGLTITATDAGASVTIAMSAHNRIYGDGVSVAVSAGNVTALAYSTSYWLYYDQASRLGGAVTYAASTSIQGNGTAANRHFIGAVTTPSAAGAPKTGNPVLPPGASQP